MRLRRIIAVLALASLLAGCGKKGPLLYPDLLVPAPVSALAAVQSGASIRITFQLPDKDLAGRTLRDLAGVRVYRHVIPSASSAIQACGACREEFQLVRTVYLASGNDAQLVGRTLVLLEPEVLAGSHYRYYVTPFTGDGSAGALSDVAGVQLSDPLPAPGLGGAADPSEVVLIFSPPPAAAGGTMAGYNLYRAPRGADLPHLPLNRQPLQGTVYRDNTLERDTDYRYVLRSVLRRPDGTLQESLPSSTLLLRLKNDYD